MKHIPACGRNTAQETLPTAVSEQLGVLYLVVHVYMYISLYSTSENIRL